MHFYIDHICTREWKVECTVQDTGCAPPLFAAIASHRLECSSERRDGMGRIHIGTNGSLLLPEDAVLIHVLPAAPPSVLTNR
jgi:hypothetical protein